MARSNFSFEKRRKELDKKKKKESKLQAKAERKAAIAAGEIPAEPIISIDEDGNVVETWPDLGEASEPALAPEEGDHPAAESEHDKP